MAALVRVALGFASKPIARKVAVWVSIIATELLDIFAVPFALVGIERTGHVPWSHGLAMSLAWSLAFGIISAPIFRGYRIGVLMG